MKKIAIITTGGTIEKTYDEGRGSLGNFETILESKILKRLRLPGLEFDIVNLLNKDSLYMDDCDRQKITECILKLLDEDQERPVLVVHGTDTMELTAKKIASRNLSIKAPVVFTGAMRPVGFVDSDATQNITEALIACQTLLGGVYIVFHGQVFDAKNVRKNRETLTFESCF